MTHPVPETDHNSIAAGDELAKAGDWVDAIAAWERGLVSGDREAAASTARIRWFLDQADGTGGSEDSRPPRRDGHARLLLVGTGCAILGTACVFLGQEQSGTARNGLAAVAWLAYIAAAALAVAYAFASGRPARPSALGLTADELRRARELAASIPIGDHPHHPSA